MTKKVWFDANVTPVGGYCLEESIALSFTCNLSRNLSTYHFSRDDSLLFTILATER